MTLADFLEMLYSKLRREAFDGAGEMPPPVAALGSRAAVAALIEGAPLFVLEDGDEMRRFLDEFRTDLVKDLADGLMTPFPSVTVAFNIGGNWRLEWLHRLGAGQSGDRFLLASFGEKSRELPGVPQAMEFEYGGGKDGAFIVNLLPETVNRYLRVDHRPIENVTKEMAAIIENAMLRIALVSHPVNFVIERTPQLTPREAKRVTAGEPRPARKRPICLVVDHDALAALSPRTRDSAGTHRPPVPHSRRGHWMRLSQRCREARSQGRTRVWRRDAYVGEREFDAEGNRYRVFLGVSEWRASRDGAAVV